MPFVQIDHATQSQFPDGPEMRAERLSIHYDEFLWLYVNAELPPGSSLHGEYYLLTGGLRTPLDRPSISGHVYRFSLIHYTLAPNTHYIFHFADDLANPKYEDHWEIVALAASMEKEAETLAKLNSEINDAENRGDRAWLQGVLAPRLVFQRADPQKTVDDQVAFIQKAQAGGDRQIEIIQPIEVYKNRAVVKCVVSMGGKKFHNLRLFVRRDGQWKLLAWANEAE